MRTVINKHIVVNSEICHGKPTFKGTRVMASDVIELVAAGVSPREIAGEYYPSLTERMIRDTVEWNSRNEIRREKTNKREAVEVT